MPTLAQTLPPADIGFLRIIASQWGIELTSTDASDAAVELSESLCDAELLDEVVSTLPREGRSALNALAAADGRMPWAVFVRRFGDVREMGPGKRDRELPHLHPISAAEVLWYRALLAKAFFNGEKGPQEFAFIPDDLFIALDLGGMLGDEDQPAGKFESEPEEEIAPILPVPTIEVPTSPSQSTPAGKRANLLSRPEAPVIKKEADRKPPSPAGKAPANPPFLPGHRSPDPGDQKKIPHDDVSSTYNGMEVTYEDDQDLVDVDETGLPAQSSTSVKAIVSLRPSQSAPIRTPAPDPYPNLPVKNAQAKTAPNPKTGNLGEDTAYKVALPGRREDSAGNSLGRPASPAEKAFLIPASDRILDDACTFLAALRLGLQPFPDSQSARAFAEMNTPAQPLREFLLTAGLLRAGSVSAPKSSPTQGDDLLPDAVKSFLEAPRENAMAALLDAWQTSESLNELRLIPGLTFEGAWTNQPLVTREFLLNLLEAIPDGQWWSLTAFVRDIKTKYPDFQRPAGDYDSWFIKRKADGVFLRGFATWDDVDGALVRYLICGPLHWLGLLDLAAPEVSGTPTAFRSNVENKKSAAETGKIIVTSQGDIVVPRLVPRVARYQVARFCEWQPVLEKDGEYRYRVTAGTLKRAREQGLKAEQLLGILRKHASAPLPPPFIKSLQRWEANGTEARVENLVVLKVSRPDVLAELRASKASRFLGEIIGPTTIVIQPGAQAKVLAALAELGLLAESNVEE